LSFPSALSLALRCASHGPCLVLCLLWVAQGTLLWSGWGPLVCGRFVPLSLLCSVQGQLPSLRTSAWCLARACLGLCAGSLAASRSCGWPGPRVLCWGPCPSSPLVGSSAAPGVGVSGSLWVGVSVSSVSREPPVLKPGAPGSPGAFGPFFVKLERQPPRVLTKSAALRVNNGPLEPRFCVPHRVPLPGTPR